MTILYIQYKFTEKITIHGADNIDNINVNAVTIIVYSTRYTETEFGTCRACFLYPGRLKTDWHKF